MSEITEFSPIGERTISHEQVFLQEPLQIFEQAGSEQLKWMADLLIPVGNKQVISVGLVRADRPSFDNNNPYPRSKLYAGNEQYMAALKAGATLGAALQASTTCPVASCESYDKIAIGTIGPLAELFAPADIIFSQACYATASFHMWGGTHGGVSITANSRQRIKLRANWQAAVRQKI